MLPLRDMNPTRRLPIITYGLIAINVIVFLLQLDMPESQLQQVFLNQAVVPASASAHPFALETILDVIRSMFFHGGWEHILGNMLYLWLFGDNVEDRFGAILYLIVYFAGGFVAAAAQVIIDPTSQIPLIGASGAIAAVLGSYLVMFPGVKVQGIIPLGRISTLQELTGVDRAGDVVRAPVVQRIRLAGRERGLRRRGRLLRPHRRLRVRRGDHADLHADRAAAARRRTQADAVPAVGSVSILGSNQLLADSFQQSAGDAAVMRNTPPCRCAAWEIPAVNADDPAADIGPVVGRRKDTGTARLRLNDDLRQRDRVGVRVGGASATRSL